MSISISRLLNVKAKLELLVLLSVEYPDELLGDSANSEWKYAGRMITAYWFAKLGPEPLADVTNEAVALAVNNADLCIFVDRLFLDDEPLYIPGVTPSSELIPAVIKAFNEKSSALQVHFRPLYLRFSKGPLSFHAHKVWLDASDRRIRPSPHCSTHMTGSIIDRYHFEQDLAGRRLTVEMSYSVASGRRRDGKLERFWGTVSAMRIFIECSARCSQLLPRGPNRELTYFKQAELLEEVLRFAVRDDLDTLQLTCGHFFKFVGHRADALALRPIRKVTMVGLYRSGATIQQELPGGVFVASWSQTSMNTVLSLLRNGCGLMLEHVLCPAPVLRALLDEDVRFTANMGRVRCFENSQDDVDETLQIMSRIGVRQFHFCMRGIRWTRILPSEALDGSVFVSRFQDAEKPEEFAMPLSIQLEFLWHGISVPAQCRGPTLRNVVIPTNVLVRHRAESATRFDVYHFRNMWIKEQLTVCLGRRHDGSVGFVFFAKGRICVSEEEIANMLPLPY
ncbi:hypothetical protein AAVH_16926 [Aphelenchoides avenae]|nr:hypothetical protein AAVH_16926 [Aphelenchus avenae]